MSPIAHSSLLVLFASFSSGGTPLEQATLAFQAGDYAKVLVIATGTKADDADGARLLYLAGEADLALGAPVQAEESFRAVLAARPQAVPAEIGLGRALTLLERFDDAAKVLESALAHAPDDVAARSAHGLLLSRAGKGDAARAELARASKLDPKSPLVARDHVEALLRVDDVPAAAAVVEEFAKARPGHPMAPFLLAWTMERDGEDEQAIEQYTEALKLDPEFVDAHKNLAILCHTLSKTYQVKERVLLAYEHYGRYFALGGKDPELKTMYDSLVSYKAQILGE